MRVLASLVAAAALAIAAPALAQPDVVELSIPQMQAMMAGGETSSEDLVRAYLARIAEIDDDGPKLNAILALNPHALADARALDAERAAGHVRGPLHGVPVLLKDNIESWDGTATTAGSLALAGNVPERDAPLVRRLTDAGAVILGKANLSEWANIRSSFSTSGWSAVGGLTRNPYALDRSACGSSSGSAAGAAASLAAAAVGTETDGSVTCPAALTGLVGIKPTVGLVSRTGIVPISHTQDTAGPLARTVTDAALLLTAMAGTDPADPATAEADAHKQNYAVGLDPKALKGARIGVMRFATGYSPQTDLVFEGALETLKAEGAVLVDLDDFDTSEIGEAELTVLLTELKADLNTYLASTPPAVKTRTLADLIAFDEATPAEMRWFGQDLFVQAQATKGLDDPAYLEAKETAHRLAGPEGIDRLLSQNNLVALVAPTTGPAWTVDLVNGDHFGGSASTLPAVAGYPHLTVPMGAVEGLPVGLSFIGAAWSEQRLLSLGYAFEQASHARTPPKFPPAVPAP